MYRSQTFEYLDRNSEELVNNPWGLVFEKYCIFLNEAASLAVFTPTLDRLVKFNIFELSLKFRTT